MATSKLPTSKRSAFSTMLELAEEFRAINLVLPMAELPCPEELINLVAKYMKEGYNDTAANEGVYALRQQVINLHNKQNNTSFSPDSDITITTGPAQAITTAISTFIKEGDEVVIFEPVHESYAPFIEMNGGRPIFVNLKQPEFRIDWDEVKKSVTTKTKMIIINNPQNPTGQLLTAEDFDQLKRMINGTRILILSNESYSNFVYDDANFVSISTIPELAPKSLIVSTFGPHFNISGWGIGYIIGAEKNMNEFRKIQQYQGFNVNTPVQHALADFLNTGPNFKEISAFYQSKRDYLIELMTGSKFEIVPTKSTIYQLLDYSRISDENDVDFATRIAKEYGVATLPFSAFQHEKTKTQMIRVCFAKPNEVLEQAAYKLKNIPAAH